MDPQAPGHTQQYLRMLVPHHDITLDLLASRYTSRHVDYEFQRFGIWCDNTFKRRLILCERSKAFQRACGGSGVTRNDISELRKAPPSEHIEHTEHTGHSRIQLLISP